MVHKDAVQVNKCTTLIGKQKPTIARFVHESQGCSSLYMSQPRKEYSTVCSYISVCYLGEVSPTSALEYTMESTR